MRKSSLLLLQCFAVVAYAAPLDAQVLRARLSGIVFDSTRSIPLAGAEVYLIGTSFFAVANDDGRFFIPDLPAGSYALSFRHERLTELAILADGITVRLEPGSSVDVHLGIPREPPPRPNVPDAAGAAAPVAVQTGGSPAVLIGTVRDAASGRPIAGAALRISGTAWRNVTDERGRFVLFGVVPGAHELDIEMLGYAPRAESVVAVPGRTLELDVRLSTRPVELDPIEVKVRSDWLETNGFYERRDDPGTFGHYFDRAEIERRASVRFSDLFHTVPGAQVSYLGPGATLVQFRRAVSSSGTPCTPPLYLDGARILGTWDFISPIWIEAVEVYLGSDKPIQYGNACGAVLVWTRRGG